MDIAGILTPPDLLQARRVLCVQPHYDDNDIGAGGTIAALHAAGAEIYYLTASDDLVGVADPALPAGEASARMEAEQEEAGAIIGVDAQFRLGYPDAGPKDYYALRRDIIKHIRLLRPEALLAPDPWLPYEAHRDHRLVGLAAAEAACLYNLLRLPADPVVDRTFTAYELLAIGFYYTHAPNTYVDVTAHYEAKRRAIASYRTQIDAETLAQYSLLIDLQLRRYGERKGCEYAEALKVLRPWMLHCIPDAIDM